DRTGAGEDAAPEHPAGQHRLRGGALDQGERPDERGPAAEHGEARPGAPGPGATALQQAEDEQGAARTEQRRAGVVEPMRPARHALVEDAQQGYAGTEAQRDVDEEDPAPGQVLGEEATERRS